MRMWLAKNMRVKMMRSFRTQANGGVGRGRSGVEDDGE
jgi:hypothetical protein